MINDLVRLGVEVIDEPGLDTHTSGHGYQEDLKMMFSLLNPEYFCPIHGEPYMRHANKKVAMMMGIPEDKVLLRSIMAENGIVGLIFKVDTKTKELVGNIQIESRGFVYSSEVKKIHTQIVEFARAKYNDNCKKRMDIKDNLKFIREALGEYITKIIGRVPMLMLMYVYINREAVQNIPVDNNEEIIGMTLEEQGYND